MYDIAKQAALPLELVDDKSMCAFSQLMLAGLSSPPVPVRTSPLAHIALCQLHALCLLLAAAAAGGSGAFICPVSERVRA